MVVNTGAFIGVFFLGPGDETAYGVLVFLSGIGFGATLAIPSDLAPGRYRLVAGFYYPETFERLGVIDDRSGESAVVLGEWEIGD